MVMVAMIVVSVVVMVVVIIMSMIVVVIMVVVIVMIIMSVIVMVVVIIVVMIIVIIMSMIVVIIMVVMVVVTVIIVVTMIIMVITMRMNDSIEVFRLSVHNRGTDGRFNGKRAVVGKAPFEDITKLPVNGVVLWFAIQVGLHTTMTFDRDHGSGTKFTSRQLFTSTMASVGLNPTDGSIATHQQRECGRCVQKRKT
jgi:hypothetical protein